MTDYERITKEDLVDIQDRLKEIQAETEERRALAEDTVSQLLEGEQWDRLCGQSPERCDGIVEVERVHIDCPLADDGCPHLQDRKRWRASQVLQTIGFGAPARRPQFDRIPNDATPGIRDMVEEYCSNLPAIAEKGGGLLFVGTVGAGKTTAMAYIAMRIHQEAPHLRQYYLGAQELWERLVGEDYHRAQVADVLYVDDLGRESLGGYKGQDADGRFDRLINDRWEAGHGTFATTNRTPSDLSQLYPRAVSRMQDRGRWAFTSADDQRGGRDDADMGPNHSGSADGPGPNPRGAREAH